MGMLSASAEEIIHKKYKQLSPYLNEASLRIWAAAEAQSWCHGGISSVSRATGVSRTTIYVGIRELEQPQPSTSSRSSNARIRQPGGGRKPLSQTNRGTSESRASDKSTNSL